MKVYLGRGESRRIVEATLISESSAKVWVRLEDGHIIARRKSRDIPVEAEVGISGGKNE